MTAGLRLSLASLGAIYALKAAALTIRRGPMAPAGLAAFLFTWPGVIPDHFRKRQPAQTIDAARFLAAWARMAFGALSIVLLAIYAPNVPGWFLGFAGIAALLLTVHLGVCDLLPWLLRCAGFAVPLLFDRPWTARSLAEFRSRRWNLAFVEMNQRLFLQPLCRRFGKRGSLFALFALSGVLHEVGISFPAGAGWGGPLGYFLLHGVLVAAEERFHIASRLWVWFWLIAPSPWLFHEPFRRTLIAPFYHWLHGSIAQNPWDWGDARIGSADRVPVERNADSPRRGGGARRRDDRQGGGAERRPPWPRAIPSSVAKNLAARTPNSKLTQRERDVLELIVKGRSKQGNRRRPGNHRGHREVPCQRDSEPPWGKRPYAGRHRRPAARHRSSAKRVAWLGWFALPSRGSGSCPTT